VSEGDIHDRGCAPGIAIEFPRKTHNHILILGVYHELGDGELEVEDRVGVLHIFKNHFCAVSK